MTDHPTGASDAPAAPSRAQKNYLTAWLWHFYAGLYVIPFLIILAVTGLIMLWTAAITDLNGERTRVPVTGMAMATSALQTLAVAEVPGGAVTAYIEPREEGRVALFLIDKDETTTAVLIDPYTGRITGSFPADSGWYAFANDIHGSLLLGTTGGLMIEAAASLGIILAVSGIYLHWPRGGTGWRGTLVPDFTAKGRAWWKSLHGTLGFWFSAMLIVFLVSGVSWALIWGEKYVQAWSTFPAEKWDAVPLSDETHASMNHGNAKEVPWALEQTPLPESGSAAGPAGVEGDINLDSVAAYARALGFDGRFQLAVPQDGQGVWTISHDSMSNDGPAPWRDRTIHLDQYTGRVLADVGFADYSVYGKAMAVGIAFHEGDMGIWNLVLNTLFCLTMIFLPVSGLVMWWKRRPEKAARIAAPPRPKDAGLWVGAAVIVAVLGAAFPMGGAALLTVLVLDALVLRFLPGLKQRLS